jgi:hypothetical protein
MPNPNRLIVSIMAMVAEDEGLRISARTNAALAAARRAARSWAVTVASSRPWRCAHSPLRPASSARRPGWLISPRHRGAAGGRRYVIETDRRWAPPTHFDGTVIAARGTACRSAPVSCGRVVEDGQLTSGLGCADHPTTSLRAAFAASRRRGAAANGRRCRYCSCLIGGEPWGAPRRRRPNRNGTRTTPPPASRERLVQICTLSSRYPQKFSGNYSQQSGGTATFGCQPIQFRTYVRQLGHSGSRQNSTVAMIASAIN